MVRSLQLTFRDIPTLQDTYIFWISISKAVELAMSVSTCVPVLACCNAKKSVRFRDICYKYLHVSDRYTIEQLAYQLRIFIIFQDMQLNWLHRFFYTLQQLKIVKKQIHIAGRRGRGRPHIYVCMYSCWGLLAEVIEPCLSVYLCEHTEFSYYKSMRFQTWQGRFLYTIRW